MKLEIDLNHAQRIHVVGIGGPGMSAIAIVLHEMGHVVTGSDIRENAAVQSLRSRGINVSIGHSVDVVADVDAALADEEAALACVVAVVAEPDALVAELDALVA